jgi:glycosyltransferase involved in cell wall biosynthesis
MRVLFLLSCLEPAGSETYCVALDKAWAGRHDVFWISDRLHFGQTYESYPIHAKAFPGGVLNTWRVLQFIRKNRIELIHSHSRRAHWVAAQAAALAKIPHVTTIHQPPPVHLFSRLFPCLGDHTIAIDEAVVTHLQTYFKRGLRRLSLIRNGIALPPVPVKPKDDRVIYLGRLTGGRWRALLFFFDVLKRSGASMPKTCYLVAGRIPPERAAELERLLKDVNRAIAPSTVEMHDFVADLPGFIAGCKGVIGGGRSAIESLAAERPVIALGEKGVIGLCTEENWEEAIETNFGDHFEKRNDRFYPAKLEIGLRQMLGEGADISTLGRWGRAQVARYYNIEKIARDVDAVYQEVAKY